MNKIFLKLRCGSLTSFYFLVLFIFFVPFFKVTALEKNNNLKVQFKSELASLKLKWTHPKRTKENGFALASEGFSSTARGAFLSDEQIDKALSSNGWTRNYRLQADAEDSSVWGYQRPGQIFIISRHAVCASSDEHGHAEKMIEKPKKGVDCSFSDYTAFMGPLKSLPQNLQ